jgi:hypothetical protein
MVCAIEYGRHHDIGSLQIRALAPRNKHDVKRENRDQASMSPWRMAIKVSSD